MNRIGGYGINRSVQSSQYNRVNDIRSQSYNRSNDVSDHEKSRSYKRARNHHNDTHSLSADSIHQEQGRQASSSSFSLRASNSDQ
ncbi:MAG: hypothetical protein VXX85_02635, partial [Candidatus Margulisiibacteriota bacterium]|nr:hypothetical protein [Candidatus Margulisiibacteriota bacterium]